MWGVKGRQDVRKADAPSNTGTHVGRQWDIMEDKETRPREGGRTIQDRHTCVELMGDKGGKTSGRRTQHPTGTHAARQWETRGDKTSGRRTHHQHRHTCGVMWGEKGKQDFGQVDTPSNTGHDGLF